MASIHWLCPGSRTVQTFSVELSRLIPRRVQRLVLAACCMLWWLGGCTPEPVDPASVAEGSWLDTPGNISCNEELVRSPDGAWLAYLLSEGRWGLSAGAPRVYRVARDGGEAAKLLGTGAYTLRWQRPGELLACARRGGSRDFGVARWRID